MVFQRRADGNYDVELGELERGILVDLCTELAAALRAGDTNPALRRLFPTAYTEDAEHERAYQALVGAELVESRLHALETVKRGCDDRVVSPDELDVWLHAVNALRLVIGTQLDVEEEHDASAIDPADPQFHAHLVYDFLSGLLAMVLLEVQQRPA